MMTQFTQTTHQFFNANLSHLTDNELCNELAMTASGMIERARELHARHGDTAGKFWLTWCQVQFPGFKSNDKTHQFNKTYRTVSEQISAIAKTGKGKGTGKEFSIESELKRIATLCEKYPALAERLGMIYG